MSDKTSKTKKLSLSGGKLTLGSIDAWSASWCPIAWCWPQNCSGRGQAQACTAAPQRGGTPRPEAEAPVSEPLETAAPAAPPASPADDKLTARERAARARALESLKKPAAEPVTPRKVLPAAEEPTAQADAPGVVEPVLVEAETLDPIEARRAAEMAELREIEAEEENAARTPLAGWRRKMPAARRLRQWHLKLGALLHLGLTVVEKHSTAAGRQPKRWLLDASQRFAEIVLAAGNLAR